MGRGSKHPHGTAELLQAALPDGSHGPEVLSVHSSPPASVLAEMSLALHSQTHPGHTLAFVQFPPDPASTEKCLFPAQVEQPQMACPGWDSTAQLPLNYLQNFFHQDQPT